MRLYIVPTDTVKTFLDFRFYIRPTDNVKCLVEERGSKLVNGHQEITH